MINKILYSLIISGLFLTIFSFSTTKAYADCQALYGGGVSCPTFNFTINKLVQVPGKGGGNYVDNLSVNDPKYSPGQNINYQLIVTNTGNNNIPTLNINDNFPQFITFVSGVGSYNSSTNTLSFTVNNLAAGKSQTFNLTAKIADAKALPAGQSIICPVNQVNATDTNGISDSDSSQACVQQTVATTKGGLPVQPAPKITTTPATGPEMIPLAMLIPTALGGFLLRKRSKIKVA